MNNFSLQLGSKYLPFSIRRFSVAAVNNATHACKILIVGGGSGGCTIANKFARRFRKGAVIVLEPNDLHYYQPLWTLVGAGVKSVACTSRKMYEVLPLKATWLRDCAETIEPNKNTVITGKGDKIEYEYLVVAVGLVNEYSQVPGLQEALDCPNSGVSTIYSPHYCEKTFSDFQNFKRGNAIFTYPDSQIKCPGAPQKIAYLADSYFTKANTRSKANIFFNTSLGVIFGVPKYAEALQKVVQRKNIIVNYQTVLQEVKPNTRQAVFLNKKTKEQFCMDYSLLHVVPPMRPPAVVRLNRNLSDDTGFLNVHKYTLRHVTYGNVFGIGDCTNTPNSKTAAAIAKQCYVLEQNLLSVIYKRDLRANYDGYGACPLITSYNTCILAEFIYGGVVQETMPFNQANESRIAYYMKRDLFPYIYWNFMLKGRYHGPDFVRKIINPFAGKKTIFN